jgi:hypothetical protein
MMAPAAIMMMLGATLTSIPTLGGLGSVHMSAGYGLTGFRAMSRRATMLAHSMPSARVFAVGTVIPRASATSAIGKPSTSYRTVTAR